jgi:hypothetical protein
MQDIDVPPIGSQPSPLQTIAPVAIAMAPSQQSLQNVAPTTTSVPTPSPIQMLANAHSLSVNPTSVMHANPQQLQHQSMHVHPHSHSSTHQHQHPHPHPHSHPHSHSGHGHGTQSNHQQQHMPAPQVQSQQSAPASSTPPDPFADLSAVSYTQFTSPTNVITMPSSTHHLSNPFASRPPERVQNISGSAMVRGATTTALGTTLPNSRSPYDAMQMHHVPHPHAHARHRLSAILRTNHVALLSTLHQTCFFPLFQSFKISSSTSCLSVKKFS